MNGSRTARIPSFLKSALITAALALAVNVAAPVPPAQAGLLGGALGGAVIGGIIGGRRGAGVGADNGEASFLNIQPVVPAGGEIGFSALLYTWLMPRDDNPAGKRYKFKH